MPRRVREPLPISQRLFDSALALLLAVARRMAEMAGRNAAAVLTGEQAPNLVRQG